MWHKLKKKRHDTNRILLHRVLQGAAEVSMAKLVLQITAEVLNCTAPPQRGDNHLDTCLTPAVQGKLKVRRAMPVLQSTAEVNMSNLVFHTAVEGNM